MLLPITCRSLEIADRRMATAIKLVLTQPFVPGSTSLVRQLMGNRVLHHCPFPQRGPVHAASASWLAASAGTVSTSRRFTLLPCPWMALVHWARKAHASQAVCRKLGWLAGDQGDGLATRTGHLPPLQSPK